MRSHQTVQLKILKQKFMLTTTQVAMNKTTHCKSSENRSEGKQLTKICKMRSNKNLKIKLILKQRVLDL
mgnify:CR=1 FL=1